MLAEFVDRQASVAEGYVAFSAWFTNDNGWNEDGGEEENDEGYTPSGDYSEDLPSSDLEGADKWIGQTAGEWSPAPEDYRPSGDLEGADKWLGQWVDGWPHEDGRPFGDLAGADKWAEDHSLNFDGIYVDSDGQLVFVIKHSGDDGTQKRVLSYEEAMHMDMGGVCNFLSAKMKQKLAVLQL